MKFLTIIFLCVGTLIVVSANRGQQFRGNARNIEFPDKCWHEETKHAFGINEDYLPIDENICQKIICQEEFVLRFETCPSTGPKPECEIHGDHTKTYPDCCPKVKPNCYV